MLPLLCIGSPLVELHTEAPADALERYGLQANAAVQVENRHWPLYRELVAPSSEAFPNVEFAVGGGAAVSAVVAARLARAQDGSDQLVEALKPGCFVYIGSVGRDEMGQKFADLCRAEGVEALLSETDAEATGWRAVLKIKAEERLVSGLGPPPGESSEFARRGPLAAAVFTGAGHDYKLDHLRFKVWESVEAAKIIYLEATFLTISPESVRIVAEHCAKAAKVLVMNLSAGYICSFFRDKILTLLPYMDYLVGNDSEFMELADGNKEMESCKTIDDVVSFLAKVPRADGDVKKKRYIMVTRGPQPLIAACTWKGFGVKIQMYPVPLVRAWNFTTKDGAGDAFMGGLLYGLTCKGDLDSVVQMALHAAHRAVQCTQPALSFESRPAVQRVPTPT